MKGTSRRRRHDKELAMQARAEAFEERLDRKIAAKYFDRDIDALKAEKRLDRQKKEEEWLEDQDESAKRRDAEATLLRDLYEKNMAKRARSEDRWHSFCCWGSLAVTLGLIVWLA